MSLEEIEKVQMVKALTLFCNIKAAKNMQGIISTWEAKEGQSKGSLLNKAMQSTEVFTVFTQKD